MINECYIFLVSGSDEKSFPDVPEKAIINAEEEKKAHKNNSKIKN
jgi:hypothetical protein